METRRIVKRHFTMRQEGAEAEKMFQKLIALFAIIMLLSSFFIPNCFADTAWQSIGPFGGSISVLAIDTTNSQTVYAGTDGGVYKSTNGGASWTAASSGMTNTRVSSLIIDPTNSQTVYAGTRSCGVYKTVTSAVPSITSATAAAFSVGTPGSYTLTATGSPSPTFSMSGNLPTGVTFNSTTGVLSGTPAAGTAGTYNLMFTATNVIPPDATRGVTLTVLPALPLSVAITNPATGGYYCQNGDSYCYWKV